MEDIVRNIIRYIQICLWMAFTFMLLDSGVLGPRATGDMLAAFSFILDPLYQVTHFLLSPFSTLYSWMHFDVFSNSTSFLPYTTALELHNVIEPFGFGNFIPANLFNGYINWIIPTASIGYAVFAKLFIRFAEFAFNWGWNFVIEYGFQQKKTKVYAKALNETKRDLNKLNHQYKALAEETYSLKDSVITDELTQIYNKRFFLNKLQQEFDQCRKGKQMFSIIMVDIDFFKKLNDNYGHLAGDDVLKSVAAVLKRFCPELCYPCRYGGEEFSIIMPRSNEAAAQEAARLIQDNVRLLTFPKIDPTLKVTLSQGICTVNFADDYTKQIKSFDEILERADQQLYRSKMEGRNRISTCLFTL